MLCGSTHEKPQISFLIIPDKETGYWEFKIPGYKKGEPFGSPETFIYGC